MVSSVFPPDVNHVLYYSIGCSIHAHFLSKRKTSEGEVIPYHLAAMEFGAELDGSCNLIQPFWPLVVTHRYSRE